MPVEVETKTFNDALELAEWLLSLTKDKTRYLYIASEARGDGRELTEARVVERVLSDGSVCEDVELF